MIAKWWLCLLPSPGLRLSLTILAFTLLSSGCATDFRGNPLRQTGGNAALFGQFQAFDGRTGRRISFESLVARAGSEDVVLFGEQHSDVVCNALEAQLLAALACQRRPVTLAMEFFETDTQAALDAYLNGRIEEPEFRKETRQKRAYVLAHRPMIEYCRRACIPVLAANAPRRLVRALSSSGKSYGEFLAEVTPADRAWLPRSTEALEGPYYDRFVEAMSGHEMPTTAPSSQPSTQPDRTGQVLRAYRSQSLWDDSMAEAIADHRGRFPDRRVMLVVGVFHVEREGGTWTKLRQRRPGDSVLTVVYRGTTATPLAFEEDDRGAGDVVIYGIQPPEEIKKDHPQPTTAPTTAPTTMPTHSSPGPAAAIPSTSAPEHRI